MTYVFLFACVVLVVEPLYFVLHNVYEDGLLGRIGLLGISFSSATFLLEYFDGEAFDVFPQTTLLVSCFAVFLTWHLFRFHRRVVCKESPDDRALHRQRAADRG